MAQTLYLWTGTFRKWSGNFGFLDTLLCNKTTNFLENLAPSKILTNWKCCELFWIGSIERDKSQQYSCRKRGQQLLIQLIFTVVHCSYSKLSSLPLSCPPTWIVSAAFCWFVFSNYLIPVVKSTCFNNQSVLGRCVLFLEEIHGFLPWFSGGDGHREKH